MELRKRETAIDVAFGTDFVGIRLLVPLANTSEPRQRIVPYLDVMMLPFKTKYYPPSLRPTFVSATIRE
ncbi:hypothetical protein ONZ45_g15475 [Pleurotus djamor]|nr:hypothetical protein ONZ45_g15475 [Pleurotus djamor]